jgi:hypothetical protein
MFSGRCWGVTIFILGDTALGSFHLLARLSVGHADWMSA